MDLWNFENRDKLRSETCDLLEIMHSLLSKGMRTNIKDESVKTSIKAWNLLKTNIEDFCKENDISLEASDNTNKTWTRMYLRKEKRRVEIETFLDYCKIIDKYEFNFLDSIDYEQRYSFKDWQVILFLVYWFFQPLNKETIEKLKTTIEKKKIEEAADSRIKEINQNILNNCLNELSKKYKIKYQLENKDTSCSISIRLRAYYKLLVTIRYSDLPEQLQELENVLSKSLEISSSSLYPAISLNRTFMNI